MIKTKSCPRCKSHLIKEVNESEVLQFLGSEFGYPSIDTIPPGQTVPFKVGLMEGVHAVPIDEIGGIKFRVSSMNDDFESFDQSSSSSSSTTDAVPALPAPPPPPS